MDGKAVVKSTAIPPPSEYPTMLNPPGVHGMGDEVIAIRISVLYSRESRGKSAGLSL
jgi:hypothetical protein